MEESTENRNEKMFNSTTKEIASWTQIHIDILQLYITLCQELPSERLEELYQKYSFGNLSHYTLFYSFMCELQSIVKNENLNPLGVLKAILNLVETYQNKLVLVHVELDKFLKQNNLKHCDEVFTKFKKEEEILFQKMGVNGEGSYICLFFHSCYFSRIQLFLKMGAKSLSAWQPELTADTDNIRNSSALILKKFNDFRKQMNI